MGLVLGHPLDTVKSLIQTRDRHKNILTSSKILIAQTNVLMIFFKYEV